MSAAVLERSATTRTAPSPSDLDALVAQIVDGLPPLSEDEKAELGRLLAPRATTLRT